MCFNLTILSFKYRDLAVLVMLIFFSVRSTAQFHLNIHYVDKDTLFTTPVKFQTDFLNYHSCVDYVKKIPALLNSAGYGDASVDTIWFGTASANIDLYFGKKGRLVHLNTDSVEKIVLNQSGLFSKLPHGLLIDFMKLNNLQQRILNYYENNGFPFTSVLLDSISFSSDTMNARLKIDKGRFYQIDSIRVFGKLKLSNNFLQHYLEIQNNSVYRKNKLEDISKKLTGVSYLQEVQPWDMTMLGTSSVLNLYLNPKKSSQMNFLVGFAPNTAGSGKLRLTGEANIDLRNAFGYGETLLFNWQQLQSKSPKLTLGYQHPYIFNSAFGADFHFDLFKKDSSYLLLNTQLGINYLQSAGRSGKIFFQNQSSTLLESGIDTNQVKYTKKLPDNIDFNAFSVGVDYAFNNLNYMYNPRSGNEVNVVVSVGVKNIKKNNAIQNLNDGTYNYGSLYDSVKLKTYQLKIKLNGSHYFAVGKQSTVKTSFSGGVLSSSNIFRNELFQIGGFKLLRGFDEESIYATQYGVATIEYRFLAGLNSYFFSFVDAAWVKSKYQQTNNSNNFISAGIGMVFETKLGLLNLSYAIGKRNDVNTNLSNASKIHFGYINYF
jgi:outer membrane protein assembly factor BamA